MLSRQNQIDRAKFRDSLAKTRDLKIAKTRYQDHFSTGRLYAHLRHDELRRAVKDIQSKEGRWAAETSLNKEGLIKEKGVTVENYEFDDLFKLPYGVGYDAVIKKRID
jgi:hypothetical protein